MSEHRRRLELPYSYSSASVMKGLVDLDLGPFSASSSSLSIDADEPVETRIRRLITEHPVIIFSPASCCMSLVMKTLLTAVGVNPTVIELEDHEIKAIISSSPVNYNFFGFNTPSPSIFIGGTCFGGWESLVSLHLTGRLVPILLEVGAFLE